MIDIILEKVIELVDSAVRFEVPWEERQIAAGLHELGWNASGSIALPNATKMEKDGIRLATEVFGSSVLIYAVLMEWRPDWTVTSDYVRSVADGYTTQIQDCRALASQLIPILAERYQIVPEDLMLDRNVFPFVYVNCWKVAHVHMVLGLEHLDPDDTPMLISLSLIA